jgi:hypothetical protein
MRGRRWLDATGGSLLLLLQTCIHTPAYAQTIPTLGPDCTFSWDANAEADQVLWYKLYLTKDGAQQPFVKIVAPVTTISCQAAGVTEPGLWRANVHAVNATTESDPSNGVAFTLALPPPPPPKPTPPGRLRMTVPTVPLVPTTQP